VWLVSRASVIDYLCWCLLTGIKVVDETFTAIFETVLALASGKFVTNIIYLSHHLILTHSSSHRIYALQGEGICSKCPMQDEPGSAIEHQLKITAISAIYLELTWSRVLGKQLYSKAS